MTTDEFGLTGQRLEDRYSIERVVAAGGFGTVYFGQHRALGVPVAIKVLRIPEELSEAARGEFAQLFLAEARTIARLHHPAVVRALDFGVSSMPSGQMAPWMALEWIDGVTLRELLDQRRGQPMSPADALALLRPVIEAIAAAHASGIAHRDIKPANIMLPQSAGALASRVLDFGIAKAMRPDESQGASNATRTKSSAAMFSLKYAAPEQIGGLRSGPWTDVHGLALVLSEMLTGREPYPGHDSMEVTAAAISVRRPTPGALGVNVGAWEAVLARALSFKPGDRHPDAGALLADLDATFPSLSRRARTRSQLGVVTGASSTEAHSEGAAPDTFRRASRAIPVETSARPSRRGLLIGGVALVALALGGGLVLASLGSQPDMHAAAPSSQPSAPVAPAQAAPPQTPPSTSVPAPARVAAPVVAAPAVVVPSAVAPVADAGAQAAVATERGGDAARRNGRRGDRRRNRSDSMGTLGYGASTPPLGAPPSGPAVGTAGVPY